MTEQTALWIVGAPRSGTTLARSLLNLHPEVGLCPMESKFVPWLLRSVDPAQLKVPEVRAAVAEKLYAGRLSIKAAEEGLSRPTVSEIEVALDDEAWRDIIRNLLSLWSPVDLGGVAVWGDKTPEYVDSMETILAAIDQSRFIHVIRDPRDNALSVNAVFGKSVTRAAAMWSERIASSRASTAAGRGLYLEVRFEDLLLEPEETLNHIASWLSLSPYQWQLDDVPESDQLGQARGRTGLHQSSLDGRRRSMDPGLEYRVAEVAGPVARELGYDLPNVPHKPMSRQRQVVLKGYDSIAFLRYYLRSWGWRTALRKARAALRERLPDGA